MGANIVVEAVKPAPVVFVEQQPVARAEIVVLPQPMIQQPLIQAAAMVGGMQKYHLHMTARVQAEHHVFRPGEEYGKPQNLLSPGEEIWNKWEAENHNRSWVEVEFAERLHVQGIGFKSAGDHPRKSPTEVRIHQWHLLEGGWREVAHRHLDFGMQFWHKIEFPEIHFDTKKVKFEFHNNRNIQGI
jgi:hypothetical protein